ncbi:MAG: sulfotransferase family protein [Deltaproteobacteria bacterium]|nr:sulfotransferase family protein [Deltaproteobacteria bacterium]
MNALSRLLHRWKYGQEIVVVSGLPRSGTSMMMKMLDAGGVPIMTDGLRTADEDNPRGYFEVERVKDLEKETDKGWLREARGKGLKVISFLLKELPEDCAYRVVFMRRDLAEVVTSQNKMLDHRGEENPIRDEKAIELYRKHLISTRVFTGMSPRFDVLEVVYRDVLDDPERLARQVNAFLGGRLDVKRMAEAVDPGLYRNRSDNL